MDFSKLLIIPLCILGGIAFVVIGIIMVGAREPAMMAVEAALLNSQTANSEAEADLANARAVEAEAEADLVTATGMAKAVQEIVDGALGILNWAAIVSPLAAPVYIGFGICIGLAMGIPTGAMLWIIKKENNGTQV